MADNSFYPPLWDGTLSGEDRARIGGFLLHYRQQILNALATMGDPAVDVIVDWSGPTRSYYVAAEAYSRYLLWLAGYPVKKDHMYEG